MKNERKKKAYTLGVILCKCSIAKAFIFFLLYCFFVVFFGICVPSPSIVARTDAIAAEQAEILIHRNAHSREFRDRHLLLPVVVEQFLFYN